MANDAEKKNIARLDFDVRDATSSLDEINKKLKQISDDSESYAKKIGDNINKSMKNVGVIDTKQLKEDANKSIKINQSVFDEALKNDKILKRKLILQNNEHNNTIIEQNNKARLKQEANNEKLLNSTKTMYDKIGDYAKTYLIYQGFNELRRGIIETIDEMVNLEYQMVQIDRVLNEQGLDIDLYRDKLIQMAYDYGNSFDNVADITLRLAQAGFDSQESLMLSEKTLLALNTAELDATEATEDMVAVMAQWGKMTGTATEQAASYGEIIDKINKVADNFPTTSADILEALKKTSSAFNIAGASIDETIASIVAAETASQRGGKAIGTALNNIITQLKDANRLETMKGLGIEIYTDETETQFNDIMDIMSQLSEKMQKLKDEGKESSVEMQSLLEVFTVFRRNIGSSLLGEMAGEDSTYAQVLETSLNSVGYSLQENEKHMKTAKAAQAQFNATLLQLKTEVWEGGLEDVFRTMLALGTDLVESITWVTKTFGAVPTAIGAVVAALTVLNKQMRLYKTVSVTMSDGTETNIRMLNDWALKLKAAFTQVKTLDDGSKKITTSIFAFAKNLKGLASAEGAAAAQTVWLTAKTIALQAVYTMGLSFAITAVIGLFNNLINAEEKAAEAAEEELNKIEQTISKHTEEVETIEKLVSEYDELKKSYDEINAIQESERSVSQQEELLGLTTDIKTRQAEITAFLKEQRQYTQDLNDDYDKQYEKVKEILKTKKEELLISQRAALALAEEAYTPENTYNDMYLFNPSKWGELINTRFNWSGQLKNMGFDTDYFNKYGESAGRMARDYGIFAALEELTSSDQLEVLTEMRNKLLEARDAGEDVGEAFVYVAGILESLQGKQTAVTEAQKELNDTLLSIALDDYVVNNVEDYSKALDDIQNIKVVPEGYTGTLDEFKEQLTTLIKDTFPQYKAEIEEIEEKELTAKGIVQQVTTEFAKLQEKYTALTTAQNELNETGHLTAATMQSLIDNNLLSYLTVVDGKLRVNTKSMQDLAEQTRLKAIESLKEQAITDLENLTIGDTTNMSELAKSALGKLETQTKNMGEEASKQTGNIASFNLELERYAASAAAAVGDDPTTGISAEEYQKKAQAIINAYKNVAKQIGSLTITPATTSKTGSKSDSAEYQAQKAAEAAKKAEEEAYKARLKQFEDYVDEKERLEKRWVDKQKELGLLTNKDFMYITQQRIERYKKYLEELKKATWMNAEDRLELEKEYSEKIEDLQVDYIGYLQDQLDDEIKALEKANDEKIKLIEEEADARIAALDKVSDATDRAREEEEYKNERQSILDEISYWEQRTGREAQEALKEAKEKLAELDAEWEDTQEDWSIEDQIKKIEEERDAEIAAIEAAQEAEIKSLQEVYDAKVKLFAETGQIIYEGSVIQSQALFNAYKTNFVDPIASEIAKINQQTAAPTTNTTQQQYETYTIKSGDTLSKIAKAYGTTVEKIMSANPYITNKNRIYAGKTLQIPKFHEGGIVGGNQEAFALLKPHEVILKTEWAASLNRMMKYFDNVTTGKTNGFTNNPVIEVKGNLIQIDADIKSKSDVDYLERRIEKMLKSKFNIKK